MKLKYGRRNYERYEGFVDDSVWSDNLESHGENNRVWAEHVMIQAVANMLHRPIEIRRFDVNGIENQDKVLIQPYEAEHSALQLGNIANLHFVAANDDHTQQVALAGDSTTDVCSNL